MKHTDGHDLPVTSPIFLFVQVFPAGIVRSVRLSCFVIGLVLLWTRRWSRDTVFGVVTRLTFWTVRGSSPGRWQKIFFVQNVRIVSGPRPLPGVKRPERDVDHVPPSSTFFAWTGTGLPFFNLNLPFPILCSRNVISTSACVIDLYAVQITGVTGFEVEQIIPVY
jgi:hypothetical protein